MLNLDPSTYWAMKKSDKVCDIGVFGSTFSAFLNGLSVNKGNHSCSILLKTGFKVSSPWFLPWCSEGWLGLYGNKVYIMAKIQHRGITVVNWNTYEA